MHKNDLAIRKEHNIFLISFLISVFCDTDIPLKNKVDMKRKCDIMVTDTDSN